MTGLSGYSPAEAALYWAADHALPGAAIEVPLSPGERLAVRLTAPHARRAEKWFRAAALHVNLDDEGVTVSPPASGQLLVTLRRLGFGVEGAAPLALALPREAALIIVASDGELVHTQADAKALTAEAQPALPPPPAVSARTKPAALTSCEA